MFQLSPMKDIIVLLEFNDALDILLKVLNCPKSPKARLYAVHHRDTPDKIPRARSCP